MKRFLHIFVALFCTTLLCATNQRDLDSLFYYIGQEEALDAAQEERILSLQNQLGQDSEDNYRIYSELFDLCSSYHFDRALNYVNLMLNEATTLNDPEKQSYATVQKGFAYLSSGLFKECCDLFEHLDTATMSAPTRVLYHITYARLLCDLADYNHVDQSQTYTQQADENLRLALQFLTPADTATYWRCMAMLDQHEELADRAIMRYQLALEDSRIGEHERAIYLSTIAYLYSVLGDADQQQHYNIAAAIADIKSSTKETVAMRWVAERLYNEGNISAATVCIKHAEHDAKFYNARHRQVEISQILPIIEQDNFQQLRARNRRINILVVCTIVLLIICFIEIVLYRKRNRALQEARGTIETMNANLLVANHIKEEYIGSFLCWQSEFLTEVEKYQNHVKRASDQRKYDDLQKVPRQADAARRREEFYRQFDEMFLRIFPTFIDDFNALLRPDEQIELKQGELLNTDLRIYALIRLGITHNEVIAEVLNYSVNTIYTYKTKIKNRSDLSNEAFLQRVMAIPSFSK